MRTYFVRSGLLVLTISLCCPLVGFAGDEGPTLIVAPFVEYQYQTDGGGAGDVLDHVNDRVGGWLKGYKDIALFKQLLLVGAEFRLLRPEPVNDLYFFASVAGTAGSAGMLGDDYDRRYKPDRFPVLPGIAEAGDIPFVDIDGDVRIRVDQYLDYYVPLQVGVRYEPHADRKISFFGSFSGGVLFYKGGMDIDVDMSGTGGFLTMDGQASASYRGKVEVEDIGWVMSVLAGLRYHWRQNLSSSVAVGFETGRLNDNADISGNLSGKVSIASSAISLDTPFSMDLDDSTSLDLRTDGWRVRVVAAEWQW